MSKEKQNALVEKRALLRLGGGEAAIQKQHAAGKMTARERLECLFDPGSFIETGLFVQHRCTNFGMDKKAPPVRALSLAMERSTGGWYTPPRRILPSSVALLGKCTPRKSQPRRKQPFASARP